MHKRQLTLLLFTCLFYICTGTAQVKKDSTTSGIRLYIKLNDVPIGNSFFTIETDEGQKYILESSNNGIIDIRFRAGGKHEVLIKSDKYGTVSVNDIPLQKYKLTSVNVLFTDQMSTDKKKVFRQKYRKLPADT